MRNEKLLRKLNKKLIEAYALKMLPSKFVWVVTSGKSFDDQDIKFFTKCCEEFMRVRGFYKDPQRNKDMNAEFERVYDLYKQKKGGNNT